MPDAATLPLYATGSPYRAFFAPEPSEVEFLRRELRGHAPLLDVGTAGVPLAARLVRGTEDLVVALDLAREGVADLHPAVVADLARLPFADGSLGAVVSRLFAYGYQLGATLPEHPPLAGPQELLRVLAPSAPALLELPLAHRPRRLQGVQESAPLPGRGEYLFRYLDVLRESPFGAVLATEIHLRFAGHPAHALHAPLHVFTPEGVRVWMHEAGLRFRGFHPPGGGEAAVNEVPPEALRAWVAVERP